MKSQRHVSVCEIKHFLKKKIQHFLFRVTSYLLWWTKQSLIMRWNKQTLTYTVLFLLISWFAKSSATFLQYTIKIFCVSQLEIATAKYMKVFTWLIIRAFFVSLHTIFHCTCMECDKKLKWKCACELPSFHIILLKQNGELGLFYCQQQVCKWFMITRHIYQTLLGLIYMQKMHSNWIKKSRRRQWIWFRNRLILYLF